MAGWIERVARDQLVRPPSAHAIAGLGAALPEGCARAAAVVVAEVTLGTEDPRALQDGVTTALPYAKQSLPCTSPTTAPLASSRTRK